ncbi:hypothetical protein C455_04101 [Haloferax larsenii JCM 13917]|nr:hypothetical protein C455_04101 [Haloferax larsenii JCM 13917]
MIARFRTAFGSDMPFWIFETGYWDGHRETQGFQDVQTVQQEVALSQNHTWMVSDKQKTFPSLGYTDGGLHYDQKGYNIMGETGGINVAARLWPIEIFG